MSHAASVRRPGVARVTRARTVVVECPPDGRSHIECPEIAAFPIVRAMTSGPDPDTAQDSLSLAGPEDQHSAADWEKATAAVLRKTRQLSDDAPDSAVWEKLTRTTLDGIHVRPIGSPGTAAWLR